MLITESERLHIKILDNSYFDDLADLLANEKVHKHFPKTLNRAESFDFYTKVLKKYLEDGYSFWAVLRKADYRFLGICGLLKQEVDGVEEIEIGYRLNDNYWGQGYGSEAAKACMEYAKIELQISSVISLILAENKASIRVAEKNGLRFEKETMFHDLTHCVYRAIL